MRVLLDECVPKRLRRLLPGHEVSTVPEMGWAGIRNGRLLGLAASAFDVLITVDKNIEHQQNLATLPIAVLVMHGPSNAFHDLASLMASVVVALQNLPPRSFTHVTA